MSKRESNAEEMMENVIEHLSQAHMKGQHHAGCGSASYGDARAEIKEECECIMLEIDKALNDQWNKRSEAEATKPPRPSDGVKEALEVIDYNIKIINNYGLIRAKGVNELLSSIKQKLQGSASLTGGKGNE